jgi:hypothetical protein
MPIIATESGSAQRRTASTRVQIPISATCYILSPALVLLVWQLAGMLGLIDLRFFPTPSMIAVTFWEQVRTGEWFIHVGATVARVLLGFAVGSFVGIVTGTLMGLVPAVRLSVYPLVAAFYPIPKIAIFPLILLIFGMGETSIFITIAATCFFLLSISAMAGVLNIPQVYLDVGRNFRCRPPLSDPHGGDSGRAAGDLLRPQAGARRCWRRHCRASPWASASHGAGDERSRRRPPSSGWAPLSSMPASRAVIPGFS